MKLPLTKSLLQINPLEDKAIDPDSHRQTYKKE